MRSSEFGTFDYLLIRATPWPPKGGIPPHDSYDIVPFAGFNFL